MEAVNQDWVVRQLSRSRPARLAFEIRKAGRSDILEMRAMQERSMMTIGGRFYARGEIETFLNLVGTMDDAVVDEGHFFVAVDPFERVIGTGAWSNLIPGYARVAGGRGPRRRWRGRPSEPPRSGAYSSNRNARGAALHRR